MFLPHRLPLFPYTTLFRSEGSARRVRLCRWPVRLAVGRGRRVGRHHGGQPPERAGGWPPWCRPTRSEEHTSELQSLNNIVYLLLLEKKIQIIHQITDH